VVWSISDVERSGNNVTMAAKKIKMEKVQKEADPGKLERT
jgi:hypothetical protein